MWYSCDWDLRGKKDFSAVGILELCCSLLKLSSDFAKMLPGFEGRSTSDWFVISQVNWERMKCK